MTTPLRKQLFQEADQDIDLHSILTPEIARFDMSPCETPRDSFTTNICQGDISCSRQLSYTYTRTKANKRKRLFSDDISTPLQKRALMEQEHSSQRIMDVLHGMAEDNGLIGDGSIRHRLPTVSGKHKDLKSISTETLTSLMRGECTAGIKKHIIIDCRYPYEYNGGHIEGAINLHTKEMITEFLVNNAGASQGTVLVFHCEFSSERAPKLLRHLRSTDREMNSENYPNLHYPEVYLLDGGYKAFFTTNKNLCFPQSYKPMLHKEHSIDLRHFRSKSKSCMSRIRLEKRPCLRF